MQCTDRWYEELAQVLQNREEIFHGRSNAIRCQQRFQSLLVLRIHYPQSSEVLLDDDLLLRLDEKHVSRTVGMEQWPKHRRSMRLVQAEHSKLVIVPERQVAADGFSEESSSPTAVVHQL